MPFAQHPSFPALALCTLVLGMPVLAVGCRGKGEGTAAGDDVVLAQEARAVFATRCTPCHGAQGAGDGPLSAGLTPRPRNLGEPAWQAEVSDAHIERIVAEGGPAVGRSGSMPAHPDLAQRPALLGALRAYVRQLGRP